MPAPKIPEDAKPQLIAMMQAGRSNADCLAFLADEYHLTGSDLPTSQALSMFRSRRGLPVAEHAHKALVPWTVKVEHGSLWPAKMLRAVSKLRQGMPLRPTDERRVKAWLARFEPGGELHGMVVHYAPETADGFAYVPARPGVDTDLIRVPTPAE